MAGAAMQKFIKSLTAADQLATRGQIRLRISGFSLQQVISIRDILQTIDALPGFHLEGLQEIAFEPWGLPGAAAESLSPGGLRQRLRGEFVQKQRRIIIYATDNRKQALHVLLHEIGHYVFFLTLNSRVKKRWVTQIYPQSACVTDYGTRNACEDFSESYALYQTDPQRLLHQVPLKHGFFRDWVFSGRPDARKERGNFGPTGC